jgi:hypothetical protein
MTLQSIPKLVSIVLSQNEKALALFETARMKKVGFETQQNRE